ncbi:MAG TPA: hypothetical protein VFD84_11625 [Candidatus Binatia bacterium]|jgi:hypothetical protein|nr:hypothetical protein [Candidatus Binatia bacterium]
MRRPTANGCDNMNHRRADAPVGHCPSCGGVVNGRAVVAGCDPAKHAAARRRQCTFCTDCGEQLIAAR